MWKDFKAFAVKGNVIDLAVAVVIGAAFGQIVSSLVDDLVMPLVGIIVGGVDLRELSYQYGEATLNYGNFLQTILDFVIIAASIFLIIRLFTKLKKKKAEEPKVEEPPTPSREEVVLTEIRDILKRK